MTGVLNRSDFFSLLAVGIFLVALAGCRSETTGVRSHLSGEITVAAEVDSSDNYEGFLVVVGSISEDGIDTLGVGTTGRDGRFAMDIVAPEKGVYPLTIRRHGGVLKQGQIVVADGDSATLRIELPTGRPLTLRSPENGAWMAYRNTKAAHGANLRQLASSGSLAAGLLRNSVIQTANVLWQLGDTYPGTVGATLGRVESIVMLSTWDDSLVVSRLGELHPDTPGALEAMRAGWRSVVRVAGLDSALATIDDFSNRATTAQLRGALAVERVIALMDGGRIDEARVDAVALASGKGLPGSSDDLKRWGEAALYEIDNLQPGLQAPDFVAVARDRSRFQLSETTSDLILLEFYVPGSDAYQQDLSIRMQLDALADEERFRVVSVSLEPDPDLNDAFIDSRNLPGTHIVAEGGMDGELARLYNVRSVPKRFLLRDGIIIAKYHGRALASVVDDVSAMLNSQS